MAPNDHEWVKIDNWRRERDSNSFEIIRFSKTYGFTNVFSLVSSQSCRCRTDPLTDKVITYAEMGEFDPGRLRHMTLASLVRAAG
jgi:hypothetical protein